MIKNSPLIIVLPLILLLLLSSCSSSDAVSGSKDEDMYSINSTEKSEDTNSSQSQESLIGAEPFHNEPPNTLLFYSVDDYLSFATSIRLSDADFDRYITANDFNMNGIKAKDDVVRVIHSTEEMPFPISDLLDFSYMAIYPDRESWYFLFSNTDGLSCSFLINWDTADSGDYLQAAKNNDKADPMNIIFRNHFADGYWLFEQENNRYAFFTIIDDCYVLCRIIGSSNSQETIDALQSFSFVNRDSFAEKA